VVSEWRPEPGAILPSRADVSMNGAVARKPLSRFFSSGTARMKGVADLQS